MEKTIEQLAKERLSNYSDGCYLHESKETEDAYLVGCYDGAISQRKIDIDKACEWLKANNGKRFNGFDIVYTQGFIKEFRKAMEELTKIDL